MALWIGPVGESTRGSNKKDGQASTRSGGGGFDLSVTFTGGGLLL